MKFEHDFAPEAAGVGFVGDKVKAAANSPPFVLEAGPGGVGGGGDLFGGGLASPGLGGKAGDFVFHEGND